MHIFLKDDFQILLNLLMHLFFKHDSFWFYTHLTQFEVVRYENRAEIQ